MSVNELVSEQRARRDLEWKGLWASRGDVFFTHSKTWLGRLIRWGESDPGELTPAWTNHTGVVVQSGWIRRPGNPLRNVGPDAVVVEALWHTRRGPLKNLNGTKVRIFTPVTPWSETALAMAADSNQYVGDRYGWWKLLFQLADRALFRGRKVLSNLLFVKDRPICSFLAANVIETGWHIDRKPGLAFGCLPQAADPDTMMRWCLAHPDDWTEVKP